VFSASACKGMSKSKCGAESENCTWVNSYKKKESKVKDKTKKQSDTNKDKKDKKDK